MSTYKEKWDNIIDFWHLTMNMLKFKFLNKNLREHFNRKDFFPWISLQVVREKHTYKNGQTHNAVKGSANLQLASWK